jgi:hypothetical protein
MRTSSFRSRAGRAAASGSIRGSGASAPQATLARQLARRVVCLTAAVGAAALGSSCALDGRAVGVRGSSGAAGSGGDGQGGTEATTAGSGGSDGLAGAGRGGSTMSGSVGGNDGLAGAGGSAAGEGGTDQGAGGTAEPDGGTVVEPELPSCASQRITGLGSAAATTTAGGEGQFTLSCAPGAADDVGIFWVAPEAGYYSIDTFGSSFDTALAVLSDDCTAELECNDDVGGEIRSELVREFAAGEAVVFAVDGASGSFGDVVVTTHAVTCPVLDLNRQSPPVATTTLDGTNEHSGACGGLGQNQREKAFRWKSPSAGLFRFTASTEAGNFLPALYLERGARCGGELIGCNTGGLASPATVVARLAESEVVTLIVDGRAGSGDVELNVEDLSGELCPNQPGFNPFDDVSGVLTGGDPSVLTGSCVPARQSVLPGGEFDLPEHSYPITIDGASCDVLITADAPVAIYVHEGLECGGRELVCQEVDDASQGEFVQANLGNLTGPSVDYVVTVEATNPNGPPVNYTLSFLCAVI